MNKIFENLSKIIDQTPIPMFIINKEHSVVCWNNAIQSYSGIQKDQIIGSRNAWKAFYDSERPIMVDLVLEGDTNKLATLYGQKAYDSNVKGTVWTAEDFFPTHGENGKWLAFSASQVFDENGQLIGAIEIMWDTTAAHTQKEELEQKVLERTALLERSNKDLEKALILLKNTQNDLIEAEKMSSLGALVGGVAHEINTPLGVCVTAITHFRSQISKIESLFESGEITKEDLTSFLTTASKSGLLLETNMHRAAHLVKSFKQVAVDQISEERRSIRLLDYLEEILASLQPELKKTQINIVLDVHKDLTMDTYPGVLAQVFTNLIMNSLIHGFENKTDLKGSIRITGENERDGFHILYEDSGKGIEPTVLKKVFDPFYTTNREGGGSGLGMHIVYNLISQKLQGSIKCFSTLGKGASFTIFMPHIARN